MIRDERTGDVGPEGVADPKRDLTLDGRYHRVRMNHLGAEVGEFHRFLIADLIEHECIGYEAWVCAVDAVHVGPDFDASGTDTGADE